MNMIKLDKLKLYNIPLTPKRNIEISSFGNGRSVEIDFKSDHTFIEISCFILKGIGLPDGVRIDLWDIIVNGVKRRIDELKAING